MRARRAAAATATVAAALTALAALAAGVGCDEPRPRPRYRVSVEVYSDRAPVAGALVGVGDRALGQTDGFGVLRLNLPGSEGQVVPLAVRCPAGLRSPTGPVNVALRTVQMLDPVAARNGVVQRVECPPQDRTIAVVIRTNGQVGLPVVWQGRELTQTDLSGVAHVTFRAQPATVLQLTLGTANAPALRPQNPARQFLVPDSDEVFAWDQEFHGAQDTGRGSHRGGGGGHRGPVRLGPRRIGPIRMN